MNEDGMNVCVCAWLIEWRKLNNSNKNRTRAPFTRTTGGATAVSITRPRHAFRQRRTVTTVVRVLLLLLLLLLVLPEKNIVIACSDDWWQLLWCVCVCVCAMHRWSQQSQPIWLPLDSHYMSSPSVSFPCILYCLASRPANIQPATRQPLFLYIGPIRSPNAIALWCVCVCACDRT